MMSERRGVKRKAADTRSSRRPAPSAQPAAGAANTPELVTSVHDTLSAIGDPVHAEQAERYMKGVARRFFVAAPAHALPASGVSIPDWFFVASFSLLWHLRRGAAGGGEADCG